MPDPNNLSAEVADSLLAARAVMGFNEPERSDQANLSPAQAAAMWGDVMTIADNFGLEIVGPCMTKDAFDWYDQWLSECNTRYPDGGCKHDAVCIHMYMQPAPCDTSKSWECFGDETGYHAKYHLDRWWNNYGNKPIWVTEYGCYPWVDGGCDASKHSAIMDQMTALFESPEYADKVARYNWFTTYAHDPLGFGSGALNVPNWDLFMEKGCPGASMHWLANAKPTYSWGIESMTECLALAQANSNCHTPLTLMLDNDNCYCSTDACPTLEAKWGGFRAYQQTTLPLDESALSASGEQYNSFGVSSAAPTVPPTSQPSRGPTSTPSRSPSTQVCSSTEYLSLMLPPEPALTHSLLSHSALEKPNKRALGVAYQCTFSEPQCEPYTCSVHYGMNLQRICDL